MVHNIVFDLAGVLIDCDPADYIASLGYSGDAARQLRALIVERFPWGKLDVGEYATCAEAAEDFIRQNPASEAAIRSFFRPGWMQIYRPKEETVRWLCRLRAAGYRIYLLSNYSREGFAYLEERCAFIRQTDGRVISAYVSCKKPDRRIYEILLETYRLIPSETVFLDDIKENVDAAVSCGMHGIVFTGVPEASRALDAIISETVETGG